MRVNMAELLSGNRFIIQGVSPCFVIQGVSPCFHKTNYHPILQIVNNL
jgi:hypothetical protein